MSDLVAGIKAVMYAIQTKERSLRRLELEVLILRTALAIADGQDYKELVYEIVSNYNHDDFTGAEPVVPVVSERCVQETGKTCAEAVKGGETP